MTPEELNRKMEFIVEHEARFSVGLEQLAAHFRQFEDWSKGLFAQMAVDRQRMIDLFDIQSRRLDRAEKEDRSAQKRYEELMREIRAQLDRIIDKLADKPN